MRLPKLKCRFGWICLFELGWFGWFRFGKDISWITFNCNLVVCARRKSVGKFFHFRDLILPRFECFPRFLYLQAPSESFLVFGNRMSRRYKAILQVPRPFQKPINARYKRESQSSAGQQIPWFIFSNEFADSGINQCPGEELWTQRAVSIFKVINTTWVNAATPPKKKPRITGPPFETIRGFLLHHL